MRVLGTARSSLLQASTRQRRRCNATHCAAWFRRFSWRWNKRSASSLDGALRKGKRAGLELCAASNPYSGSEGATHSVDGRITIARVRGTARYASAIAGGADVFAVCGGGGGRFCACALPIPKEGPLGTISVRFNSSGKRERERKRKRKFGKDRQI